MKQSNTPRKEGLWKQSNAPREEELWKQSNIDSKTLFDYHVWLQARPQVTDVRP